jgi:L-ascorbate metabolism protein UlaG (beta-lactamase superfamily)
MRRFTCGLTLLLTTAFGTAALGQGSPTTTGPSFVDITWMSISNVLYELGTFGVLTDGYITRIPQSAFFGGGGGLAQTRQAFVPDLAAVERVLTAIGGPSHISLLLTGHSHFDHSFDTPTWSRLTNAPIIGSKTTCLQAQAEGLPESRCRAVVGGERIAITAHVWMRVIRWNHSGDSVTNPEQHNPVELDAVPPVDPVTGGLHAGVAEAFPNGGGNRAYLFVADGPRGRFTWFFQNSLSLSDISTPIVIGGVDYGAPIENLRAALHAEGLSSVDLWIGTANAAAASLLLPILTPKAYLPVHWDGLYGAFQAGVPRPYSDAGLESVLAQAKVQLLRPVQYMDKWRLDRDGVRPIANDAVKKALGF